MDQFVNFTNGAVLDGTHLPDGIHPDQVGYDLMGASFAAAVIGGAVPEPGTLSLLVLGAAAMLRRRVWVA
ncbi:MAG: PEP-CTERM sorting domain-containing protein [Phycisphaerales bacterium]|nr:PEP-CTERM sorting domain-containing protein [Phycisphaerales bacterium]